jgi:hypothetical protein
LIIDTAFGYVNRANHTPRQKALAIAAAYETIGIKPEQAIQFTKWIHNHKGKNVASLFLRKQSFSKFYWPKAIQNIFEKIVYSANRQYKFLKC